MRLFSRYPGYTLAVASFQFVFLVGSVYWIYKRPSPGQAVAVLGVAAVVMAIRAERFTLPEKVAWIAVGFTLLYVEIRAIDRDREVHDREQAQIRSQEAQHFESI